MAHPNASTDRLPPGVRLPTGSLGDDAFGRLEASAARYPHATAFRDSRGELSCRELLEGSLLLAGYLQQHLDLRRGERVLLVMDEGPRVPMAWFAALRCGAAIEELPAGSTPGAVAAAARASRRPPAVALLERGEVSDELLGVPGLRGCIVGALADEPQRAGAPWLRQPARLHAFGSALEAGIAPAHRRT